MAFGDTGRSFLWWHKRGRTCISVSGVFAILILWQARLSGRNVSVRRQTADNTSALSHVFPLERASSVQGFVPSIIFYFCLLSWFKPRLSAYSSPVISRPRLPPPLALRLSFFPLLQICYFLYSHSPFCLLLLLKGGWGLSWDSGDRERHHTNLRGPRYGASEGGTPIFSLLSMYGHSAKEGKMYGGDWKRKRRGGVMEAEGSIISAGWVGGGFFSSRSGGKFIYFPGSYNEILLSTLLWWWERSAAINLSCHLVASDEPFIMPPSRTQHGICMIVLFYVMISISLCHITQMRKLRIKLLGAEQV